MEIENTRTWSKSYVKFQLNMSKHVGEKCWTLCISSTVSSNKHTESIAEAIQVPHQPQQIKICKYYFSALVSKDVGEKCVKLRISYILSPKRGKTPTRINANKWHWNLICSTVKESHMQNFSSICQRMSKKNAGKCVFPIF